MAEQFQISQVVSRLLINRGINNKHLIESFINPVMDKMHPPTKMKDIEAAVYMIKDKIREKKKIRIVGDYDVDGVISTYILYQSLIKCGAYVDYAIPHRMKDGYGINKDIIHQSKQDGVDTIITCDNGISAIEPIQYAKELGLTVIVTDHHDIPFVEEEEGKRQFIRSAADAIINPKQKECTYPFKQLCGAGVVFKLIQYLYQSMGIKEEETYPLLEFVGIATVCDVVDLIDENRIFVKQGLAMMNQTENKGLRALIKETGLEDKVISTYHLGFIIGPCINASGRLDSARKGVELLLSETKEKAQELAKELYELNQERKEMTQEGVEKAIEKIEKTEIKKDKVFVIYLSELHESLAGIVAGRIKEIYHVPTIVLTDSEEGIKGSGRSIDGYNMFEELLKCKHLLSKFGGHPMAAGLSLQVENMEPLRQTLNKLTELTEEDRIPKITLDMQLPLDSINYDFIQDVHTLEPFGKGNPKPLFGEKKIKVVRGMILGQKKNVLKLKLRSPRDQFFDGIYFGSIEEFEKVIVEKYGVSELEKLYQGSNNNIYLDLVFYPGINQYNGNISIQLFIEDFR